MNLMYRYYVKTEGYIFLNMAIVCDEIILIFLIALCNYIYYNNAISQLWGMVMNRDHINKLRQSSRKLIRELGMLQIDKANSHRTPRHWHSLIEIAKEPGITISKLGQILLLSTSATSRMITALQRDDLVHLKDGIDKREKYLYLTKKGLAEIEYIDEFSDSKIIRAFELLTKEDQEHIISGIEKYADALEKSRIQKNDIKIHTLSTSRALRKQIISMIETIQIDEFSLPITPDINASILKAEQDFYFNNSYNFWYAIDKNGKIIGSIGLKKINKTTAEIKKFFVEKNYRGKGIAQKLMQSLLDAAIKHQFKTLYLGTVAALKAAQRFYKKNGFIQISKNQLPTQFELCPLDTNFFKGNTLDCINSLHDDN